MTILKTDTVSGIGTEGTVFEGDITFDSLNYMTLPKGTTTQSNRGRGVIGSGYVAPARVNTIDYITIQSEGNATDFGDLLSAVEFLGGVSSPTRGVFGGGSSGPYSANNVMQYVTIATEGNAVDFGDLVDDTRSAYARGLSNAHGGL